MILKKKKKVPTEEELFDTLLNEILDKRAKKDLGKAQEPLSI